MDFRLFNKQTAPNAPKSSISKQQTRKMWIRIVLTVLISSLIIVYLMPRSATFNYEYREGHPWRYGDLFAKQKFNIEMSDSAISAQEDSVRKAFQPYFNVNATVRPAMIAKIKSVEVTTGDSENKVKALSNREMAPYVIHASQLLDTVYSHGVVSPQIYDSLQNVGVKAVRLITNNVAYSVPFSSIFSTQSAYQFIMNHDRERFSPNVMARLNINLVLEENARLDYEKSKEECDDQLARIPRGVGLVVAGERIVSRGEIVTPEIYLKLKSYDKVVQEEELENDRLPYIIFGQFIMVLIVLSVLASFVYLFRRDYWQNWSCAVLLYSLVVVFSVVASLMVSQHFYHIFMVPVCFVPIVIRVFLDSRTAFVFHTGMILLISFVLTYPYEFILLQLVAGLITIQTLRELQQRSQVFQAAFIITVSYMVFYTAYELTVGISFQEMDRSYFMFFLINGVCLLFTYPMLWALEKSFGFVSDVTLVELSNINHPLLQELSENCPGTFQHSMQVANLAAEVAKKIGAKVQLVRTGALYHDIGKTKHPGYFTENQGSINPHDRLTEQRSAAAIIEHVTYGVELAGKYKLPDVIKRFITTHHGKSTTRYFYIKYKNAHPDEEVDPAPFTYPGPNPSTAEEAILMMCDGVEAASRSLQEYTEDTVAGIVDKIVDSLLDEGYFSECDITLRDISIAKSTLKERLVNIYHTRITYPELNKPEEENNNNSNPQPQLQP